MSTSRKLKAEPDYSDLLNKFRVPKRKKKCADKYCPFIARCVVNAIPLIAFLLLIIFLSITSLVYVTNKSNLDKLSDLKDELKNLEITVDDPLAEFKAKLTNYPSPYSFDTNAGSSARQNKLKSAIIA